MNETLEETKHFQSSVEGVGGATDDMEWHGGGAANKQFQQLNEQRATMNMEHPPATNVKRLGLAPINGDSM